MKLTSKERNFLRKKASSIETTIRIGKNGLDTTQLENISQLINKNEIVKVKVLNNSENEASFELASNIEKYTNSILVGIIGHIMIFFKKKVNEKNEKGPITKEFYDFRNGRK
ncbi:YhbY family RNA-binding protein [Oceanivirga miroungae]|uniref:RNA-binding protein n=1 Tax=Oceanivirga miroungae TaxID=1130046 RepID=A0A6I8MDX3_9FUSO|nr:YhbY family RNA-binding protein [Oceanivirga miroungae]VWL85384.1 RNA-binding protein [Oceanivirga miroungae]